MKPGERIEVLTQLGDHLLAEDEYLQAVMHRTEHNNRWFTIESQEKAVRSIADSFLRPAKLKKWLEAYSISDEKQTKAIGLVLAGNIPLVGFHDMLCVFVAGHKSVIKLSEKDSYLLPYFLKLLKRFDARTGAYFEIVDRLKSFDAVIATGSNNSARYFEAYFGKYPNIIRKNRNAIAVLTGEETTEELAGLAIDVFQYFGLGCRNVSKVYLPQGYSFEPLLEALQEHKRSVLNTKYKNNFDYNYALYILNKTDFKATGSIILTENSSLQSRIAGLHYEFYNSLDELEKELTSRKEEIQCIVSGANLLGTKTLSFGHAQEPELWDYADGVDTMEFLLRV